jgi:thymidylate synthase (FAD)
MNFTIVEPGFEFFEPPNKDNYLQFLERCTRVCYKSEEHIKEGSAEKLMTKVVREYEHLSVTEHLGMIVSIEPRNLCVSLPDLLAQILELQPLFRHVIRDKDILLSGNIRMWMEFLKTMKVSSSLAAALQMRFNQKFPFFAIPISGDSDLSEVIIADENPLTNLHRLSIEEMSKHMTLTVKVICDRATSHQLVRHRLFAYSQESQRYCNYGKKGLQVIKPPSIASNTYFGDHIHPNTRWELQVDAAYGAYIGLLSSGIPPEDARSVLPNCTKTEVVMTGTLEQWKHVFAHRGHNSKAQWQIREIMLGIEAKFKELLPKVFNEN